LAEGRGEKGFNDSHSVFKKKTKSAFHLTRKNINCLCKQSTKGRKVPPEGGGRGKFCQKEDV